MISSSGFSQAKFDKTCSTSAQLTTTVLACFVEPSSASGKTSQKASNGLTEFILVVFVELLVVVVVIVNIVIALMCTVIFWAVRTGAGKMLKLGAFFSINPILR